MSARITPMEKCSSYVPRIRKFESGTGSPSFRTVWLETLHLRPMLFSKVNSGSGSRNIIFLSIQSMGYKLRISSLTIFDYNTKRGEGVFTYHGLKTLFFFTGLLNCSFLQLATTYEITFKLRCKYVVYCVLWYKYYNIMFI